MTNAPEDWVGNKYKLDGTTWSANPDWVEPEEAVGLHMRIIGNDPSVPRQTQEVASGTLPNGKPVVVNAAGL